MLLDIITIVLRETLEASVLISLLLLLSQRHQLRLLWLPAGLVLGTLGAWIYAASLPQVSEWFDYVGQEVTNASMQYLIYLALLTVAVIDRLPRRASSALFVTLLTFTVAMAMIREGAEVIVFYSGYIQSGGVISKAIASGLIGLLIGVSVGVLVYYALTIASVNVARSLLILLLMLVGAGMVMQATQLLQQADWITHTQPLWDSNWLLPEASIMGQLTYAVFGYEANPSLIEATLYLLAMVLFLLLPGLIQVAATSPNSTQIKE